MAKITYIEHNGREHTVEVPAGWSVMEGAALPAVEISVPLVVDARAADNWDEAH